MKRNKASKAKQSKAEEKDQVMQTRSGYCYRLHTIYLRQSKKKKKTCDQAIIFFVSDEGKGKNHMGEGA